MRLHQRLKKIISGSFLRDVAKLTLGTLAGRFITIAVLPLLTRLYSPDDFALLATYVAIVSTISVAACLRLEIAVPLADCDKDANNLLVLAIIALTIFTSVTGVIIWMIPEQIIILIRQPEMLAYLWIIPIGIAGIGTYSIAQYWATREHQFTQIAQTRITQALIGSGTSVALGWAGMGPIGLLLGNMLNSSAGGIKLAAWSWRHNAIKLKKTNCTDLYQALKKYRRYPIYSTPESLLNTAGAQLPVIIISAYAGAEAGFLTLATQIMAAPMGLLGKSISQVYISRAPQALLEARLAEFTRSIMLQLFKIGAAPIVIVAAIAPILAPYIFGSNWVRTGEIVSLLAPWMLLQFIASPVSIALHLTGHQAQAMIFQAFGFILRILSILLAAKLMPSGLVEVHALSGFIFYGAYIFMITRTISAK